MMNIAEINQYQKKYRDNLLESVMPFWLKNGVDYECGGYISCLDREGEIYNYEKSVWFQGRTLWILSHLMKQYGEFDGWRKAADCGYEFIQKCISPSGRMAFSVTREGKTIQQRRYYFSETFAAIALAEYGKVTGNAEATALARKVYSVARALYTGELDENKPKFNSETFDFKGFSAPMILLSTAQTMRINDDANTDEYNKDIEMYLKDMKDFYKKEHHALFENVKKNGECNLDVQRGRLLNPGHAIEGAWFLMDEYEYSKDEELKKLALDILNDSFKNGWDEEMGGLRSFVDALGMPVEPLESDMKMWWPHCETIIAFLKAYRLTGDEKYLEMFKLVDEYTFSHFIDEEYGEWYGYLNRDGSVAKTLKGSMFKGAYHIPRCLMIIDNEMELLKKNI